MKRTLLTAIAAIGLMFTGCQTTPNITKEDVCAIATTAYAVYLAIINADGKPSDDQIAAAQAAALILQMQCGWQPPEQPAGKSKALVDKWNVPVLVPKL